MSNEPRPRPVRRPRTPILHKRVGAEHDPASPARLYYLVARGGLYIGRNHEFFRSCVPAPAGPGELAEQLPFLAP